MPVMHNIYKYCNLAEYEIIHTTEIKESYPEYFHLDVKTLSNATNNFLKNNYPKGIYKHQKTAFENFQLNKNVCLTTSTASGKSLCFHLAAIELLAKNPKANIIAIYPTKALGKEQEDRMISALAKSGLLIKAGRIDGDLKDNKKRLTTLLSRL